MSTPQQSLASQKRALSYAVIIALVFAAFFLSRFFSMFVIAGILAYLFTPLYNRLRRKFKSGSAATITVAVSLTAILIPVFVVIIMALSQVQSFYSSVSSSLADFDITQTSGDVIDGVNGLLADSPFEGLQISQESLTKLITRGVEWFGKIAIDILSSTIGSVIGLVSASIIFLYVFFAFIKKGPALIAMFRGLNPLGNEVADLYITQIGAMVRGTVFGQLVIAFVQGLFAAATVSLVTEPSMFFVMLIVFTAFSVIPLGAGILVMPIGVVLMLFGNVVGGLIILLEHLVINTNVDNVLRPVLVPDTAKLDPALMLVSVFAGIAMFGFLGIVIGPTLMILIVTTIKVYLRVHKGLVLETDTAVAIPEKSAKKRTRS